MVVRPRNFDPGGGRRLPVIVDVYGGPGANKVHRAAAPYLLDQWMADQGFAVVALTAAAPRPGARLGARPGRQNWARSR